MAHEVPPLPYAYNALEPHIDEQTMRIHHDKHHAAYVTNLNAALEKAPQLQQKSVDDVVRGINSVPEEIRTAVRNNGGGRLDLGEAAEPPARGRLAVTRWSSARKSSYAGVR